ncbi:MAG: aminomethyl-transferring glycine dehydrogenase, partial [Bacteroidota bacterium]
GLPIANASLLDEGTSAAEAMTMFYGLKNKRNKDHSINRILVSDKVLPQTVDILRTRALPVGIELDIQEWNSFDLGDDVFAVLLQYPNEEGKIEDYREFVAAANAKGIYVIVAADLLSLALITPPGEWGADAVVGVTQRFGIPMGFGGPHAAYFATKEEFKRNIPGRIIGVSIDRHGNPALRMALQTREQHIRRDKATSNICTAQALLATMAGMYGVFHGPDGIKRIASRVHGMTQLLAAGLTALGLEEQNTFYFDTLRMKLDTAIAQRVKHMAEAKKINLRYIGDDQVGISLDETVNEDEVYELIAIFAEATGKTIPTSINFEFTDLQVPSNLVRETEYMTHPVFQEHRSESRMMRYIKKLENKDLSLMHSMIALGSCTMKLNAATELIPVSWPEFANMHPFAPSTQTGGYQQLFDELEAWLCEITGFDACSLQPNSGAQGEYSGLMCIRAYHLHHNQAHRNIAIIPASAHGTNPASAVMAGMKVVVVKSHEDGSIDVEDLKVKVEQHKDNLAALMVTYPSTHGVFETAIKDICALVHENGGLVYMDGANMNAQVGLTSPAIIGADVCHLNLHKTFAIPHGGGGPGMGPICVNEKLAPFLPGHIFNPDGPSLTTAVSSTPYSSASILLISYGYIKMLGASGVTASTEYAILNANYIKARLEDKYAVLYVGDKGRAAHELILDLRPFKAIASAEDVAKRLIDYGFHAPTLSFPVAGTIMIEPTESEDKVELDRFCEAMLAIHAEMEAIASGAADAKDNVLVNAPHTVEEVCADEWVHPYSRSKAAYPLPYVKEFKFWASVARVNNSHGDRNLICTCPPIEVYESVD